MPSDPERYFKTIRLMSFFVVSEWRENYIFNVESALYLYVTVNKLRINLRLLYTQTTHECICLFTSMEHFTNEAHE